jgi:TRAP-type mannitol/chloroaromatic compound transport system substrate-binding protein
MQRRSFVRRAAAGSALLGMAGCVRKPAHLAPAGSAGVENLPELDWILASSFSRSVDIIFGASETLAARVAQLTGGRFVIRVKQAGEHVGATQVLDAVQSGSAQMGHTAGYYYRGKHPALVFDTSVPFGLNARQHTAWMLEGGGMELLRPIWAQFGVVNLLGGNTGVQMGGWYRREIRSVADLKGMIMRIAGFGGDVLAQLGVVPKVLGVGEIFPSLERGAIDAAEWVGPYDDEKLSLHKVAQFYYFPGWWEPGAALSMLVNQKAWDALPEYYREALGVASREATLQMLARYDAKNPAAMASLLAQGVKFRKFPDDVLEQARVITGQILDQQAAANPEFAAILTQWRAFKDASDRWLASCEHGYTRLADALTPPLPE